MEKEAKMMENDHFYINEVEGMRDFIRISLDEIVFPFIYSLEIGSQEYKDVFSSYVHLKMKGDEILDGYLNSDLSDKDAHSVALNKTMKVEKEMVDFAKQIKEKFSQ